MKIAILTQPLTTNYGGLLQAFALQRVLRNMGHDAVTVDIREIYPQEYGLGYKVLSFGKRMVEKHILGKSTATTLWDNHITAEIFNILSENTRPFIDKYIATTQPLGNNFDLSHLTTMSFDAYIVGSDQCWRSEYSASITPFFLDFASGCLWIKRVAYAASFGVDQWEMSSRDTAKCRKLVKLFDAVSVREDSAVELCRQHLDVEALHVIDPTLLLDREVYDEIISAKISTSTESKTVATYLLDASVAKDAAVERLRAEFNLERKNLMPQSRYRQVGYERLQECVFASVEDWLAAIRDAEMVVVDSFHGVVFSIIFQKPFIAIGNRDRGLTRFTSLLKSLELEQRLVLSPDEVTPELMNRPIDYDNVMEKLMDLRQKSSRFLHHALM